MWEESSPERESGKTPSQNVDLITTPPESEASPFCLGKKKHPNLLAQTQHLPLTW